jgi:peptidoglycan/xylan/chitin deacetylase (PgdA/CDA1 family)
LNRKLGTKNLKIFAGIKGIKDTTKPSVAITFDDGPDEEITPWVLDFLKEHNIKATFFCVGTNVQKYPEIYAEILANGHVVGNHTMNHENGFKTKDEGYLESIEQASKLIDSKIFRPPYGRLSKSVEKKIYRDYKIVMWSWLSFDYDQKVPVNKIIRSAKKIKSGDILVFHDNQKTKSRLKAILPSIVENLKKTGFNFRVIGG